MIIIISPAKTLDFTPTSCKTYTLPRQLSQSQQLIDEVKKFSPDDLSKLMKISPKLALLNRQRYHDFCTPFTTDNAKQALLAFQGDVYKGIDTINWTAADFAFAQQKLRILSGLYGVLRPLDLIQPYRLEMGTALKTTAGKDLYAFWGNRITELLAQDLSLTTPQVLINLASIEYFKSVHPLSLPCQTITIHFQENKNGTYKTIGIHAKRARGLLSNFIIKNRVNDTAQIKQFNAANYAFNASLSSDDKWVFTRG